jgi:hypothetical protein
MLSMAVCKKCVNSHPDDSWDSEDTSWFRKGSTLLNSPHVICPPDLRTRFAETLVESPPPKWCPHKHEHAVAAGMSDA